MSRFVNPWLIVVWAFLHRATILLSSILAVRHGNAEKDLHYSYFANGHRYRLLRPNFGTDLAVVAVVAFCLCRRLRRQRTAADDISEHTKSFSSMSAVERGSAGPRTISKQQLARLSGGLQSIAAKPTGPGGRARIGHPSMPASPTTAAVVCHSTRPFNDEVGRSDHLVASNPLDPDCGSWTWRGRAISFELDAAHPPARSAPANLPDSAALAPTPSPSSGLGFHLTRPASTSHLDSASAEVALADGEAPPRRSSSFEFDRRRPRAVPTTIVSLGPARSSPTSAGEALIGRGGLGFHLKRPASASRLVPAGAQGAASESGSGVGKPYSSGRGSFEFDLRRPVSPATWQPPGGHVVLAAAAAAARESRVKRGGCAHGSPPAVDALIARAGALGFHLRRPGAARSNATSEASSSPDCTPAPSLHTSSSTFSLSNLDDLQRSPSSPQLRPPVSANGPAPMFAFPCTDGLRAYNGHLRISSGKIRRNSGNFIRSRGLEDFQRPSGSPVSAEGLGLSAPDDTLRRRFGTTGAGSPPGHTGLRTSSIGHGSLSSGQGGLCLLRQTSSGISTSGFRQNYLGQMIRI